MLVVLSAGLLTALTATATSMAVPAFADKKKCEDNDSNNCNDKEQKLYQKNDCKNEDETKDDSSSSNSNTVLCSIFGLNQDKSAFCPVTHENDGNEAGVNDNPNCPVTNTNNQP